MAFAIDQEHLPAVLSSHPMSDEEFAALCAEHPDLSLEMTAERGTHRHACDVLNTESSECGAWGSASELGKRDRRGVVSDSSGGFVMPNGARRSPDAAWTLKSRVQQLGAAEREGY
jgi:Uma2 family endonuclease